MEYDYFDHNATIFYLNETDAYSFYYNLDNYFGSSAGASFGINPSIKGVLVFLYAVIILISLLGNTFICLSYKNKVTPRTNTNLFILAISINDIIQILFEPFLAISNIIFYSWPYPSFTCPLVIYVQFVTVNFKAFILVAMTCEKYVAITTQTRRCYKRWVACVITSVLFFAATLVALPTALYTSVSFEILSNKGHGMCLEIWPESSQKYIYSVATMILQYFLPILVMGVSYTHIIVILQRHRIPGEPMQDRDERLMKSKKKAVKMLVAIFVCYAVVWLPLHIITILGDLNIRIYDQYIVHICWLCAHWMGITSCCINSVVYYWRNENFRNYFISSIKRLFCASRTMYRFSRRKFQQRSKSSRGSMKTRATTMAQESQADNVELDSKIQD